MLITRFPFHFSLVLVFFYVCLSNICLSQSGDSSFIHGLRQLGSRPVLSNLDITNNSGITFSNETELNNAADDLTTIILSSGITDFKVYDYASYSFLSNISKGADAEALMAGMEKKISGLTSAPSNYLIIGKILDSKSGKVTYKAKIKILTVAPSPTVPGSSGSGGVLPKFDKNEVDEFNRNVGNIFSTISNEKGEKPDKATDVEIGGIERIIKWAKENKDRVFDWSAWYAMPSGDNMWLNCTTILNAPAEYSGVLWGWVSTENNVKLHYKADIDGTNFKGYKKYIVDPISNVDTPTTDYYSEDLASLTVLGNTKIQYVRYTSPCAVDIFQNTQNLTLRQRSLAGIAVNWPLANIQSIQNQNFLQNLSVAINVTSKPCNSAEIGSDKIATELYRIESSKIATTSAEDKSKAMLYCSLLAALDVELRSDFWNINSSGNLEITTYHEGKNLNPVSDYFFFKNKVPRSANDYQQAINFLLTYATEKVESFRDYAGLGNSSALENLVTQQFSYKIGDVIAQAAFSYILTGPFKKLVASERKSLIAELLKNTACTGSYYRNGTFPGCEDYVLLTIENTPDNQATDLLKELHGFHTSKIIDKTGGLNDWQRKAIISKLARLWSLSSDYDNPLYNNTADYFKFNRGFIFQEGRIKLKAEIKNNKISFQPYQMKKSLNGNSTSTFDTPEDVGGPIELSPYDEVLFICKFDFSLGKDKNGNQSTFSKGQQYRIPAMLLFAISKKDVDKEFAEGVVLLVEAAMFVALSEIAISAVAVEGWVAAAPQLIDLGVYMGDLAINQKVKTDPGWANVHKDLVAAYCEVSFLWFGMRGFTETAKALEKRLADHCGTNPAVGSIEEEILTCLSGKGACFTANTPVYGPDLETYKPIKDIKIGDYVASNKKVTSGYYASIANSGVNNKIVYSIASEIDPDPYTSAGQKELDKMGDNFVDARIVTLSMPKADGSISEIKLLRPKAWLEVKGISEIGSNTYLHLAELGLDGYATVVDIAHYRATKNNTSPDDEWAGGLVTGVFRHVTSSIFKLQFSNGDSIEVTGTHPIYSLDRKGFIPVSEITTGEKLLTMNGFVEVGKTTESDEKQQVYNLEVGQWHNFLVGGSGVVVHNYCFPFAKDPSAAFNEIKIKWGYKMTANEMKELNNAISRVKLKDTSIFPFDDGKIFQNSVLKSPTAQRLNTGETYREWTVKTPGISNRGERRIVVGNKTNRAYYTHDHYDDFIEIDLTGWK